MIERIRFVLGLAAALALSGGAAHAQYYYPGGYGGAGYGFGGWGQTVQGSVAAGMGAFAQGAGQYNYQTAAANSINANTVMQWNSYMWASQNAVNREHYARMATQKEQNKASTDAIAARVRDNPNDVDIDRGDALNAVLQQLTHPKALEGSGLAAANGKISSKLIKNIPFRNAPAAVIICIDNYRNNIPELLKSKQVETEREAFAKLAKDAAARVKAGEELSEAEIAKLRETGMALYNKVDTGLPDAPYSARKEALDYLKSLKAFFRMLRNPEIAEALRELDKVDSTTVGNLVAFMHTFNLRFGPATTPEQKAAYRTLYPVLRADRDKVLSRAGLQATADMPPPAPPNPTEIFKGIADKHLDAGPGGK
jgi:hypothetical protein